MGTASLVFMTTAGAVAGSEVGRAAASATSRALDLPRNTMIHAKFRGAMGGAVVGILTGAAVADQIFLGSQDDCAAQ